MRSLQLAFGLGNGVQGVAAKTAHVMLERYWNVLCFECSVHCCSEHISSVAVARTATVVQRMCCKMQDDAGTVVALLEDEPARREPPDWVVSLQGDDARYHELLRQYPGAQ